jgi:hypothetical protein
MTFIIIWILPGIFAFVQSDRYASIIYMHIDQISKSLFKPDKLHNKSNIH